MREGSRRGQGEGEVEAERAAPGVSLDRKLAPRFPSGF